MRPFNGHFLPEIFYSASSVQIIVDIYSLSFYCVTKLGMQEKENMQEWKVMPLSPQL